MLSFSCVKILLVGDPGNNGRVPFFFFSYPFLDVPHYNLRLSFQCFFIPIFQLKNPCMSHVLLLLQNEPFIPPRVESLHWCKDLPLACCPTQKCGNKKVAASCKLFMLTLKDAHPAAESQEDLVLLFNVPLQLALLCFLLFWEQQGSSSRSCKRVLVMCSRHPL